MRILVSGGAGYIGSHVAKTIHEAGHEPVVFDNLSMGHRWAVQWGTLVEADLNDQAAIEGALEGVDAVIHLAGSIFVGESVTAPSKYYRNNFVTSLNLLDAMVAKGVKNIVFSSTCATYGIPEQMPIPESEKQQPINPYGESKLFVERALASYGVAHGIRSLCLRYFNAAGADRGGKIGEMHFPETHLIPLIIYAAMGLRKEIRLFGTDYETADGTAVRDYVHVDDLGRAHLMGIDYLMSGGGSTAVNLGTGDGSTVREVIAAVEQKTGKRVTVVESPRREGDSPVLIAQADAAWRVLGWKPVCSGLDEIVSTACRWHEHALKSGLHVA